MKTEHILIIRFSAIGDVAMMVPVVYTLAHQYPNVRITVLSRPFARNFFENLMPNVGFMEADLKNEYRGMKGLNALFRRLSAKHFTAIADLHNILRSSYLRMLFNMSRYKVAHIDKHRKGKHRLVAQTNKVMEQQPTSFQHYADVFERLGYPIDIEHSPFTSIFPPEGGLLRLLPPEIGEKKVFQQWIGIAPYAAHQGKIYPIELMTQVVELLVKNHPSCRIFLFGGGAGEMKQFDQWASQFKQCTNASALLNGISQELILMSHLDVMLSMDSANMHLASLTATPVVSVWGATHPFAGFLGWHQRPENIVQSDLPCRPCSVYGGRACRRGDYACLSSISPSTIVEAVERVISNGS